MRDQTFTPSIQDYAKAVYALQARGGEAVSTNELAQRLGVTPGSASGMVRKLAELGLLEHVPYRGFRLTPAGKRLALKVIRRHRLLELFLAEALQMSWDQVHAEAEVLEHALSEELEQLIAERLGDPRFDPHGDPIPTADFELPELQTISLLELGEGRRGRFVRVSDSDPEKLRYLAKQQIELGDLLEVKERQPFGGPLVIRCPSGERAIGSELAGVMRVEPIGAEDEAAG
jgi:DtxR family Mn-dependent transcriptional regulator